MSTGAGGTPLSNILNVGACTLSAGPYTQTGLRNYSTCATGTQDIDMFTLRFFSTGKYLNFTFTDHGGGTPGNAGTYSAAITQI